MTHEVAPTLLRPGCSRMTSSQSPEVLIERICGTLWPESRAPAPWDTLMTKRGGAGEFHIVDAFSRTFMAFHAPLRFNSLAMRCAILPDDEGGSILVTRRPWWGGLAMQLTLAAACVVAVAVLRRDEEAVSIAAAIALMGVLAAHQLYRFHVSKPLRFLAETLGSPD